MTSSSIETLQPADVHELPAQLATTITAEGFGEYPDRIIASIEYKGMFGYVRRSPIWWNLCGYVILPPGHKYHGKHYDNIDIHVHGGLTYGEPEVDGKGMYTIGFDCAHAGDYGPGRAIIMGPNRVLDEHETYKDLDYVVNEIIEMIDQL